ncbi:hypothetical protein [Phenylobacterium sp.]|jgi:hypothetical protein|uniref:hypothetical protein n=1 Tax=Phenylobacterium sp. TaxID=1871053 RepID=UPI0025F19456|nr:hypothetical protein [Phenylobacterium sp.]MBX3484594.1 hypothetical protein [Phenylobacterium sp.]MCW5759929.1 hypothetical protein [Phenylobacterium sp.]
MLYVLSAVGQDLIRPLDAGVLGAFDDAVREAEAMLERYPVCEAVEIFVDGRFVRDVPRRLN